MKEVTLYSSAPEVVKTMAGKTEYKNKWQAENCERISLVVKKGRKQAIKEFAAAKGDTLNGFINKAIDEKIERDSK